MPATRKELEDSMMGGRGGESNTSGVGGRRAAAGGGGGSGSRDCVGGEERGAASMPALDSTLHTIYRSPSAGSWLPDSEVSRYSLLPPAGASVAATTASLQQLESAAAMMKLAYRNRLHDRNAPGSERRTSSPGGDVTGGSVGGSGSGWRLPAGPRALRGVALGPATGAEAPPPLRGEPELPRFAGLGIPLADVCEASVVRQRLHRDPSSSSEEGRGLDRQPSLTDLRSLDSESDSLAAAMPPATPRRRHREPHELPSSSLRIHQSQSPPHDRLRSSRQMSASTTFHGLRTLPGYTERTGGSSRDAAEGLPSSHQTAGQYHQAVIATGPQRSLIDYQMWSTKIVELQQMSNSLTQGIENFIRIAKSSDPQYADAMPPAVSNGRHSTTTEGHISKKIVNGSTSIVTSRTLFSRTSPAIDTERLCETTNVARGKCVVSQVSYSATPADRYEGASHFERRRTSRTPDLSPRGSYLYRDEGSFRGSAQAVVGDTVDSLVTIAAIPSLRGVGMDANEALKRQSAEVSGDTGGYRPGEISPTRRQCTGESGDFEPSGPLVNSETTSSVEVVHCSGNCICKEDRLYGVRAGSDSYPSDLTTVTLFQRIEGHVEQRRGSAVGMNFHQTEEAISKEIHKDDSSTTNETAEGSICWIRGARSEAVISSCTSDFILPDSGLNYKFPAPINGIDEMRAMLLKERTVNTSVPLLNDSCCLKCQERNSETADGKCLKDTTELKNEDGENNLSASNKKTSGHSLESSNKSSGEPSYDLEQHFLPTSAVSYINDIHVSDAEREVIEINNDLRDELNAFSSKSVATKVMRQNDTAVNISCNQTASNTPNPRAMSFKTVSEEEPMENICISSCALKTLLSGHGIMEDVKEMRNFSTTTGDSKDKTSHHKSLIESMSPKLCENDIQSDLEKHRRHESLKHEAYRTTEVTEKDIYAESNSNILVNAGTSHAGKAADVGLYSSNATLITQGDVGSSGERSRSITPMEDCRSSDACQHPTKEGASDDSASGTSSASTSLFGGEVHRAGETVPSVGSPGTASDSSSSSELVAPTNSYEDMAGSSRKSPVHYDARKTLNLVRELICKDGPYNALRPEHDTDPAPPPALGRQQGQSRGQCGGAGTQRQAGRAGAAAGHKEPRPRYGPSTGVHTVFQPRLDLRHTKRSQTFVAVREFPNIPATDNLQRTAKSTNLKGAARPANLSPREGPARLHQRAGAAPARGGPTVPSGWPAVTSGWPAVSARPLHRHPAAAAGPLGLSRSAGSSPRPPCSAYTREPLAAREPALSAARSKDATAADALLADAASLFRSKLDAWDRDRRQGEQRRLQRNRPLSAAARLSAVPVTAASPNLLRMLRPATSNVHRQSWQETDNWHQRQQQLQQRQLQLQQRQQQLQQRQLQLQQRQQMQQRQQRLQQAASWQQQLNKEQLTKSAGRRPAPSRSCRSPGAPEPASADSLGDFAAASVGAAPGSASLRMLQARLRAGGSLHCGVTAGEEEALWAAREQEPEGEGDCPTRDAATPEEPEDEPPQQADSAECSAVCCQEPAEAEREASCEDSGGHSDTSPLLDADVLSEDGRISEFLSDRYTARFANYLPAAPVRERDEEDFICEIMFYGQGDVVNGSFDNLLLPCCATRTPACDFNKSVNRENTGAVGPAESEHLIRPPDEFSSDMKAGVKDNVVQSSQLPQDSSVVCNPVVSIPPAVGLEITPTRDAHSTSSCIRLSNDSLIPTWGDTETSDNIPATSNVDQLAKPVETTSENDTDEDGSEQDHPILSHSACSSLNRARKVENLTEGQNNLLEENPLHKEDPVVLCCDLCSVDTNPLTLDKKDTACGFITDRCSPLVTNCREECSNGVPNAMTGETIGSDGRSPTDNSTILLPIESMPLSVADGNMDQGNKVEQDVKVQETANCNERNIADNVQDQNDLDILAVPTCCALSIKSSPVIVPENTMYCDSTANNDVKNMPPFQESTDVGTRELSTEQNKEDNTLASSCFTIHDERLSPTLSDDYTDCGITPENTMTCLTEDKGERNDPVTTSNNLMLNTSVSLPNKQSVSSLVSQGSSLTLWYTSADEDSPTDNGGEPQITIQEQCKDIMPCAVDVHKTGLDPQAGKCVTDVAILDVINNIDGYDENNSKMGTASKDLQLEDSFRDAEDDTASIISLTNNGLTDVSSGSDLFSTVQSFSDSDDPPSSPVVGTGISRQLPAPPRTSYVDSCDSQLSEFFSRSQEECALYENHSGQLNETVFGNNDATERNGKITSMGIEMTSSSIVSSSPALETSSTNTNDAKQNKVVDVVPSATSWVTVSTMSSVELSVDASITSMTTAYTENMLENIHEHVESSSVLSSESNISPLVITGAKNEVENTAPQVKLSSDNADRNCDVAKEENYTLCPPELALGENVSILAGTQEANIERMESFSDNSECIQDTATNISYTTPSSALPVVAQILSLVIIEAQNKAENILKRANSSSANTECIASSVTPSSEVPAGHISSPDFSESQNNAENISEPVKSSWDNTKRIEDKEIHESYVTPPSELEVQANTSRPATVAAQNNVEKMLEQEENFPDNAVRMRDMLTSESHVIPCSDLPVEETISSLAITGAQNKVENIIEHLESLCDNAEHIRDIETSESYVKPCTESPFEATISSAVLVAAENRVENSAQHVDSSSDNAEGTRHTTTCENQASGNDTTSGKDEDGASAVVSNEKISEEIPLGEPSASWETLSEQSCADEDAGNSGRGSAVKAPPQQRQRRHRRATQRRAARGEEEDEEEEEEEGEEEARRILNPLELASLEVEFHLSEALSHSERESPLLPPGPRLAALGSAGGAQAEQLVAALAGVALDDADADAEDAADILYGSRDVDNAVVDAAVACFVDRELRSSLSTLCVQRRGGCLLLSEGSAREEAGEDLRRHQEQGQATSASSQVATPPEDDAYCRLDEDSPPASPALESPTCRPPAPRLEDTPSSCSLNDGAASHGSREAERPRSHAIATLLTALLFLAAYSSCLLLEPRLHVP